jgi:hypothetical protein
MLVVLAGCARVAVRIPVRSGLSQSLANLLVGIRSRRACIPPCYEWSTAVCWLCVALVLVVADFSWNNICAILPVRSNMFTRATVLRKVNNCGEVVSGFLYPVCSASPSEGCSVWEKSRVE